jgi:hypothetical protein
VKTEESGLMDRYNGSLYEALKDIYYNHPWDPSKFKTAPHGYWNNIENRRRKMEEFGQKLKVKQLEDWYNVAGKDVKTEVSAFMHRYNGSLYEALRDVYNEYPWDPSKFKTVPRGYWNNIENRRQRMEEIGEKLRVKKREDWYNVSGKDVITEARGFMSRYKDCLYEALKDIYRDYPWDPSKFKTVPRGYWISNTKKYETIVKGWKKTFNIQRFRDWYKIPDAQTQEQFQKIARGIFGSVTKMLETWFPNTNWSLEVGASKPELTMQVILLCSRFFLTTSNQLMLNIAKNIEVHYRIKKYTVDVYIPEWNLAVEYNGEHHYHEFFTS